MAGEGSDYVGEEPEVSKEPTKTPKSSGKKKKKRGDDAAAEVTIDPGGNGGGDEGEQQQQKRKRQGEGELHASSRESRRQSGDAVKMKSPRGVSEGGKRLLVASIGKVGDGEEQPPRRVMKNPDFLQEHRDKYKPGPHQKGKQGGQQQRGGKEQQQQQGAGGQQGGDTHPLSNLERNKDRKFMYGNYDTYYNYRNPGEAEDPRLKVMKREWFDGRRCLDIGCNSGAVTIEVAKSFSPRHIMGVDIDKFLVVKARSNLKWQAAGCPKDGPEKVDKDKINVIAEAPASATAHKGTETRPSRAPLDSLLPDPDADPFAFPYNCGFRHEDFAKAPHADCEYDTILALSVTKWVHYHTGDEGVKKFFKKVRTCLFPLIYAVNARRPGP